MEIKGNLKESKIKECEDCNIEFELNVQCCPICNQDLKEITIIETK